MSTIISSVDLCCSGSRALVAPRRVDRSLFSSSARRNQQCFAVNRNSLLSISIGQRSSALRIRNANMNRNTVFCNVSGIPSGPPSHSWRGWMIGMILTVVIPFWRHRFGSLQMIKNRVDMVMNTVEAVAEVVETVAHKVEEVADGIADHLPEDGKLKAAVEFVEAVAKETAKDAHMVDCLVEKVEQVEDKVEDFFDSAMLGAGGAVAKADGDGGGDEESVEEPRN